MNQFKIYSKKIGSHDKNDSNANGDIPKSSAIPL